MGFGKKLGISEVYQYIFQELIKVSFELFMCVALRRVSCFLGMLRPKSLRETPGKHWATKVRKSWGGKAGYIYIYMVGKCGRTVWQWFHFFTRRAQEKIMGWSVTLAVFRRRKSHSVVTGVLPPGSVNPKNHVGKAIVNHTPIYHNP